jgi:alpha-tubulin suppressor-like RCC1 family protein
VPVATDVRFASVVAGDWNTCGLDLQGHAFCWGRADVYQLSGARVSEPCYKGKPCSFAPVAVQPALAFKRLALGSFHACGITVDDRIVCWGSHQNGQLGSDSAISSCPVQQYGRTLTVIPCRRDALPVIHPVAWREIGASVSATCGLDADGGVYCWGLQVGDVGAHVVFPTPRRIEAPGGVSGLSVSNFRSVVLSREGLPLEWGVAREKERDLYYVSAVAAFEADEEQALRDGPFLQMVTGGGTHTCGLTAAGDAYCWGMNARGQLGTGSGSAIRFAPTDKWRPGKVAGGWQFRMISGGGWHTCGITTQGGALCWGWNALGQLGIGSEDALRREPAAVAAPTTQAYAPAQAGHQAEGTPSRFYRPP